MTLRSERIHGAPLPVGLLALVAGCGGGGKTTGPTVTSDNPHVRRHRRQHHRGEPARRATVSGPPPDPSYLVSDGLHPSDRGDAVIAAAFDAALAQAGYPAVRLARR